MNDEYEEKEKIPLIYIRSVSFVFDGYYSGNWDDKTKKDFDEIRGTSSIPARRNPIRERTPKRNRFARRICKNGRIYQGSGKRKTGIN